MKKLTFAALLSIALVSCKKETKTVTKTDPETGKTITVEVPVEDSAKTENQTAQVFAIKDSLGVFHQSFKLEKGKSYPLKTVQKDTQIVTAPNGQSQSGTNESTDEMIFTVNDFANGVYDITINLMGKRNSQSANGKTIVVDTKTAEPKEEQLKIMWKVNKALVGNMLKMKMDDKGKVISITGFEPVYAKVSAAVSPLIQEPKMKSGLVDGFKKSFNEKILKEQFTKNLVLIPEKGVKIGEKWTRSENATPDGKIKIITNYTLKSAANGIVEISVAGGMPKQSDKQTNEGVTRSITSELTQNGKILLDQNSGWVKNQNIAVKTSQTETLSDGKESQSMKSVSQSSVMVNP